MYQYAEKDKNKRGSEMDVSMRRRSIQQNAMNTKGYWHQEPLGVYGADVLVPKQDLVYTRKESCGNGGMNGTVQMQALAYTQDIGGLRKVCGSGVIQRKIQVGEKVWELSKLLRYIFPKIIERGNLGEVKREDVRIVLKDVLDKMTFDNDDVLCTAIEKIILLDAEEEEHALEEEEHAPEEEEHAPKERVAPIELPEPYTEPVKQRTDTAADTADQHPEPYTEPVNPIPGCYFFMPHVTGALVLYRSMSEEEYIELLSTIDTEKKALFKHKKKGGSEKFFAPNIKYLVGNITNKGKRRGGYTVKVTLHPRVLQDMLHNPEIAGVEMNTMNDLNMKNKDWVRRVEKRHAIIFKGESDKEKKHYSQNIGFRPGNRALEDFAGYIISIQTISEENFKTEMMAEEKRYIEDTAIASAINIMVNGRIYDVAGNQGEQGSFWRLLRAAGLEEHMLKEAANQANVQDDETMDAADIESFVGILNALLAEQEKEQIRIHLDMFSHDGIHIRELEAGSGSVLLEIGLAVYPDGKRHYVIRVG